MTSKKGIIVRKSRLQRKPVTVVAVTIAVLFIYSSLAYGAFFDTAGQSARPMGMGEVFIASSGSASGYWYNPAGLASTGTRSLDVAYGVLTPNVSSDLMKYQLSYTMPMGSSSGLGLGISGLGADGANEMVISGAYGMAFDNLAIGGNVKVLRWAIEGQDDPYSGGTDEDLSKVSFSLDLSATYSMGSLMGLDDFTTGVYVRDAIMPNISESGDDGGKLPVEVGVGFMGQRDMFTGEVDIAYVNEQTIARAGVETGMMGTDLKLRGGFVYGSDFEDDTERTDFDFGIGYMFNSLLFDYAYNLPIAFSDTGGRHFVSFGVSF